jgi:hypothetical protein
MSEESPGPVLSQTSQFDTSVPVITVALERDTYGRMSVPSPSHCPFPSCGAVLGPHRVLVGWSPGHRLNSYRCAGCERTWCPTGPDDPRGRPANEYGPEAGRDR